jgi:Protein of unknown function (DUF2934)
MPEAARPASKAAKSSDRKSAAPKADAAPAQEAIAKRAYELYLQRGSVPGYELEDWLSAEAELIAAAAENG